MINNITEIIIIFLDLIKIMIFIEIILSWLFLFGIKLRLEFISGITLPIYTSIRKIIPTSLGPVDFAPIIVFLLIEVLNSIVIYLNTILNFYF